MGEPDQRRVTTGHHLLIASAQGVGVQLADDLVRSASQLGGHGVSDGAEVAGFTAAARQIASKLTPTAYRPESKHQASSQIRFCPEGVGARLASDPARSDGKFDEHGVSGASTPHGFTTTASPIASKLHFYGPWPE